MNNDVYCSVKFMRQDLIDSLFYDIKKHEAKNINQRIEANKENSNWLKDFASGEIYEEKKYKFKEFNFTLYNSQEDKRQTNYRNAVTLYEHLNSLPRYILTDERFWAWMNFDKGYKYALQAMPITSKSTIGDHYLFGPGKRRGIFFGVLSRLYFWVDLTVDENNNNDRYWLTRFAISNIERIRTLTWRANSSEKHIVRGALKAEYRLQQEYMQSNDLYEKFRKAETGNKKANLYTEIAKAISLYGGVRLLDVISEEEYIEYIYEKGKNLIEFFNKEV